MVYEQNWEIRGEFLFPFRIVADILHSSGATVQTTKGKPPTGNQTMKPLKFDFQTFLKTPDKITVQKFATHASIMVSVKELYPLENIEIVSCGNEFLVTFRHLTETQFRQISAYFYAVEFSLCMK